MKKTIFGILIFIVIASAGFARDNAEKSVTFVVTGNVRAEFNLCG